MNRLRMRPSSRRPRSSRTRLFAMGLCCAAAAALGLGLAGCAAPDSSPTSIPIPSVIDTGTWGSYGSKASACFGVAGDVLSLALVPNNLALADSASGVSDIDASIRTAGDAAPAAIAPYYTQMSALVRSFGVELTAWQAAVDARATATAAATATASPSATPAPTSTAAPTSAPTRPGDDLLRPAFDGAAFTTQLDDVKAWLSSTCG